jgi:hypothetical protein
MLATNIGLLAAARAWEAGHPTAAVVLLSAQALIYAVITVCAEGAGHPTIRVQARRRDQRRATRRIGGSADRRIGGSADRRRPVRVSGTYR